MNVLLEGMLNSLDIRPVPELLPHEETLAGNSKRLKEAMLNLGQLVDPLIVDRASNVVLDGNHRLKVLQIIECPFAACQLVDYQSPSIHVGTWYPVTETPMDELLKMGKMKAERVDCTQGKGALQSLNAPFMAARNAMGDAKVCDAFFLNPGSYKLREMIEEQNYLLSCFKGVTFDYIPDDLADEYLAKGYTVLFRRPFTKEEIIRSAQAHVPFPPKSTRHTIPDRIVRLNMRLGWLHEGRPEALAYLRDMLSKRAYDGNVRRYNEPVIVIY